VRIAEFFTEPQNYSAAILAGRSVMINRTINPQYWRETHELFQQHRIGGKDIWPMG
jgi:hypothetical protein